MGNISKNLEGDHALGDDGGSWKDSNLTRLPGGLSGNSSCFIEGEGGLDISLEGCIANKNKKLDYEKERAILKCTQKEGDVSQTTSADSAIDKDEDQLQSLPPIGEMLRVISKITQLLVDFGQTWGRSGVSSPSKNFIGEDPARDVANDMTGEFHQRTKTAQDYFNEDKDDFLRGKNNYFSEVAMMAKGPNFNTENGCMFPTNCFVVDSGCSDHMSNAPKVCFSSYQRIDSRINTADSGKRIKCVGVGTMNIIVRDTEGKTLQVKLERVLHVPGLTANLLSVSAISSTGTNGLFTNKNGAVLIFGHRRVAAPQDEYGLYRLPVSLTQCDAPCKVAFYSNSNEDKTLKQALGIHRALGHKSLKEIKRLLTLSGMVRITEKAKQSVLQLQELPCNDCLTGKAVTTSLPKVGTHERSKKPGEIVHSDSCGPFQEQRGGRRYLQSFIDDHSRYTVVYKNATLTMRETLQNIEEYDKQLFNRTGKHIGVFRADNGSEFDNHEVRAYCRANGIRMQFCIPYKHGQNGVAERFFRTITEAGVTQLSQSGLPARFLFDACVHFNYVRNITPAAGADVSPHERFYGVRPPMIRLLPFGCQINPTIPPSLREKHTYRTEMAILLGYAAKSKGGYLVYRPTTKQVVVRDDVSPMVDVFPGIDEEESDMHDLDLLSFDDVYYGSKEMVEEEQAHDEIVKEDGPMVASNDDEMDVDVAVSQPDDSDGLSNPPDDDDEDDDMEDVTDESAKSWHERHVPSEFALIANGQCEEKIREWALAASAIPDDNPTWGEAMSSPNRVDWKNAVVQELQAHLDNHSFDVVSLPEGQKTIASRWVLTIKRNADGKLLKYKGRMVAKGFQTKYGVHYFETFAPTISSTAARMVIAVAVQMNFRMIQMDVKTAFLIPRLPEELGKHYMRMPEGFEDAYKTIYPNKELPKNAVLDLKSVIYGLKPAARFWNNDLSATLIGLGLKQSEFEPCLFVKMDKSNDKPIGMVAVYVDDLIVSGSSGEVERIRKALTATYPMKDLGFPSTWTGVQVHVGVDGALHMHQGGYVEQILQKFGFQESSPEASPTTAVALDTSTPTTDEEKAEMVDIPFRNALGCLLWLTTNTRPDIAFAVHQVARRAADPSPEAWRAIKRILRYLKGTPNLGITFRRSNNSKSKEERDVMICLSDTDWAGDTTRHTTASSQVYLWGAIIAQKIKQLKNIALSSMEAELMGYSETGKLGIYILHLAEEMGIDNIINKPIPLYGDNDAARLAVIREGRTSKTRHIEVRHYWIREKVQKGIFRMERVSTEDNSADIGTKPLGPKRFIKLVKMVVTDLPGGTKNFKNKKT